MKLYYNLICVEVFRVLVFVILNKIFWVIFFFLGYGFLGKVLYLRIYFILWLWIKNNVNLGLIFLKRKSFKII